MNIGGITIEMAADVARLRQDMEQAKGMVGGALGEMQRAADMAKVALGAVGVALSLGAIKNMVTGFIDAAEGLHDLSIQTGMTVERLSALQELGRTTGTSVDTIANVTNKLAKNMAVASEESKGTGQAIAALGLDFAAFKSLKPDDQLVTLAKAMGQFEDGSGKSAIAMTLLGKEGAKLLPFMKDLADANELVATTTAEQAAQADQFNDAMEESRIRTDAMMRSLALGLLPTLIDVHTLTQELGSSIGQYLGGEAEKTGQKFDGMALVILGVGTVLESLIVLSSDVAFVLNGIGREIGGLGAQAAAFLSGDFAGASAIGDAMKADAAAAREGLDAFQASITGATAKILQARDALRNNSLSASENANEMDRLTGAHGKTSKAVLNFSAAAGKADKTLEQLKKRTDDYLQSIDDKLNISSLELAQGEKLSEAQKAHLELTAKLADGTISLTAKQEAAVRQLIDYTEENRKAADAVKALADTMAAVAAHSTKLNDAQVAETATLREKNVALAGENDSLLMSEQALRAREVQQLRAAASEKEWSAAMQGGNWQLEEQARLLRERATLVEQNSVVKEAKAATEAWKGTTASIEAGLTDAFMRGLEKGQSMWVSFRDSIVGMFKNLVLQPTIRAVMTPLAGGLTSLFTGGASAANGGGAGGGVMNLYQAGKSLYDGFSSGFGSVGSMVSGAEAYSGLTYGTSFGSQQSAMLAAQDAGLGTASTALGTAASALAGIAAGIYGGRAISGGYSAFGGSGNSAVNVGTAAGAIIGSIVPVIGTAFGAAVGGMLGGLVNRAFGHKAPEVESRALEGSFGGAGFAGNEVTNIVRKGGWFSSDKRSTETDAVTGELDQALDSGAAQLRELASKYGAALGLPVEQLANVTTNIKVVLTDDAEKNSKAIGEALQLYSDALLGEFAGAIEPLRQKGETVAQTIERVGFTLLQVNGVMDQLGLSLLETSVAGGQAATQLVALFGGLDQLSQAAGAYYSNFYSEAERAAMLTEQMTATLAEFGLTMPATREEYRALVEAQDRNTEAGRAAFAVLLQLGSAFAGLVPAAEQAAAAIADVGAAAAQVPAARAVDLTNVPGIGQGQLTAAQQARVDADPYWAEKKQLYGGELPAVVTGALVNFFGLEERQKAQQRAANASSSDQRGRGIGGGGGGGSENVSMGWDSATQALIDAMQGQIEATGNLIDSLGEMSAGLRELKQELIGGEFDPASPEQKYLTAKAERESLARQAMAGDMAAAAAYQGGTQDFLRLSQGYNASGSGYVADFNGVLSTLETIADKMDTLNKNANATLKVQQAGLQDVVNNTAMTVQLQKGTNDAAKVAAQRNVE